LLLQLHFLQGDREHDILEVVGLEDRQSLVVQDDSAGRSRGDLETLKVVSDDLHVSFFDDARLLSLRTGGDSHCLDQ